MRSRARLSRGACGWIGSARWAGLVVVLLCSGTIARPLAGEARWFAPQAGDWPVVHGQISGSRYSPLDQVDASNVGQLRVAWRWRTDNFGPRPETLSRVTPLVVNGVMYATAGSRRAVVALDPGTGETLWTWRMDEGRRWEEAPRRSSGRGLAWWTDGRGDDRVLTVTPGFHLVALSAATGYPVRSFGEDGVVDLMNGLRGDVDPVGRIGSSSPPLVLGDVVVVGAAQEVGFRPPSMRNTKGDVRGFDARSGELLWTFHTVPEADEPGAETWLQDSAAYTGNAAVWAPMSADPNLGLVYLPVEAPTGDYYGGHRPGDNLFGNSVVALDVRTGERRWHFQVVHHDIWDYDNPTAPILADVTVAGRPRKALVQLTKQAFAYVLDRETGEPIWPITEMPVPQSDVPGERTSPTQPFPSRPAPFDRQGVSVEDLIDFTPQLREAALEAIRPFRLGALFAPPSLRDAADGTSGTLSLPGALGGANWEHGAVDPDSGLLYVGSASSPGVLVLGADPEASDMRYVEAGGRAPSVSGLPLVKPPWGRITAIDLNTGEHAWMRPNGAPPRRVAAQAERLGIELGDTGKPGRAGLLVTATLLFAGEGAGGDPVLRALAKATGATVAEIALPASQTGLPMTYLHRGRQYIALAVGGPGSPAEIVALALPAER